ncbi:hypothetical protein [Alicyclobacillus fastidiosus]|uniref:Uncharacterized protein n=1 Tax=Alicyclobacillus fastidiosus TaxID=392011 RepID=A0ABV5ABU0_9BACL|nr:hypothetical protein [Alicyclobacillus fastidiosus]WEH07755.1 hypothetical protein PYS47_13350 [Alicyclobacillus fastidiosus]
MAFTVPVVAIFTNGALSSATPELRRARFLGDLARANEAWGSGFPGGVRCELSFVSLREFYRSDVTINAGSVTSVDDPRVDSLINDARKALNDATAIYTVYLSGLTFSTGAIGNGGPAFKFFRSPTDYGLYGRASLSDRALDTYAFAHEAGHCLFGRFTSTIDTTSFTINDPSNPGSAHSSNPKNLMYPIVPSSDPIINATQCTIARDSRIVMETVASTSRNNASTARKKKDPVTARKLNKSIAAKLKTMKPTRVRTKRTTSKTSTANKQCCKPAVKGGRILKKK